MEKTEKLQPEKVFHYFEEISAIPHGSGNTEAMTEYLCKFAEENSIEHSKDQLGNVIMKKGGSAGYENAPAVILQGHMDMVCEKAADCDHDFTKDPLKLKTDGDYLYAEGTTLGGDDGIAEAYILTLLADSEIAHPPIEAVFTTDEEIGLLGAAGLDMKALKGRLMINLDSESEGVLVAGCAGGIRIDSVIPIERASIKGLPVTVGISGLKGGHSGEMIDKGRINANRLMGRYLHELDKKAAFSLADLSGGNKDNAIPAESKAHLVMDEEDFDAAEAFTKEFESTVRREYAGTDEAVSFAIEKGNVHKISVIDPDSQDKIIFFLTHLPDGVRKMSGLKPGMVETSANLGIMRSGAAQFVSTSSTRSSLASERDALTEEITTLTELLGGTVSLRGKYPAWEFRKDSPLREKMTGIYKEMFGKELKIEVIHAGLECGLFYENIPDLDAVSIGPDLIDIHTPNEKMSISSVARTWDYLCNVLAALV